MIEKASFFFFYHSSTLFPGSPVLHPQIIIKEIILEENPTDKLQPRTGRFRPIYVQESWFTLKLLNYCTPLKLYFQPRFLLTESVIFSFLKSEFNSRMTEDFLRVSWKHS